MMSLNVTRIRMEQDGITGDDLFIKIPCLSGGCKSASSVDLVRSHSLVHLRTFYDHC